MSNLRLVLMAVCAVVNVLIALFQLSIGHTSDAVSAMIVATLCGLLAFLFYHENTNQ